MARAIIIKEMVERCKDCVGYSGKHHWQDFSSSFCMYEDGLEYVRDDEARPDWCPLIPAIGYVEPVGNMVSWEDEE